MKKFYMIAALFFAAVAAPTMAQAQIHLNTSTNDPVTGLPADQWARMIGAYLHLDAIVGQPQVVMINATPDALTVSCDRWSIVGTQVYKSVQGNPAELKPFSITVVRTNEFDGYCKNGVTGRPSYGDPIIGRLNDPNGSFTNATTVTFIRR